MQLKKGELRVFYRCAEEDMSLDPELERFLRRQLRTHFNYASWASGTDFTTGTRELAFEKKGGGDEGI